MKSRLGQSMVETAIILPVFLLIVFGIIEFSRAFFVWQALQRVATESARFATLNGDLNAPNVIRTNARNEAARLGAQYSFPVTVDNVQVPTVETLPVVVTVSAPFNSPAAAFFNWRGLPPFPNILTGSGSGYVTNIGRAAPAAPAPAPAPPPSPAPGPAPAPPPAPAPAPAPSPAPAPAPPPGPPPPPVGEP